MKDKNLSYINPLYLIGLLFVCPLLVFVMVIDITILNRFVLRALPTRPEEWAIWLVFFSLPHILTSFFTMADKENTSIYGTKMLKAIVILFFASVILNGIIPSYLNNNDLYAYKILFFCIYGLVTIYHLITQQLGIGLILCKATPGPAYKILKWLSISLSYLLFLLVLVGGHISPAKMYLVNYAFYLCAVLLLTCIYFSWRFSLTAKSQTGKIYIYLNLLMFTSVYLFAKFDYAIFALIVPRFIHDLTAFIIYSNHDENKFKLKGGSYIYRIFHKLPLPISIISPLLGVVIAYSINHSLAWTLLYIALVLDFLHYYIESFIWKGNGSHRQYLKITNT
jgi:hypothetical protein